MKSHRFVSIALILSLVTASVSWSAPIEARVVAEDGQRLLSYESKVFDFENNTTEGWEPSTKDGEKAISQVAPTTTTAFSGTHSLRLTVELDASVPDLRQGFAYVMYPGNLEGRTITARMRCDDGMAGDAHFPNGIQVFIKDQSFGYQQSEYRNITGTDWIQLSLTPSSNAGFDATQVQIIGVKLGVGGGSTVPVNGSCFVDVVTVSRASLVVPPSDHLFNYSDPRTAQQQQDKIPSYWDINPGWGAGAWNSDDITVRGGNLVITANFQIHPITPSLDIPERKGFISVTFPDPGLNLSYKSNRVIRAKINFAPYVGPETISAAIWVFDKQDGGAGCTTDCKWYRSREIWVGGSVTNELVFDLDNPAHFYAGSEPCEICLPHSSITAASLKNIYEIGIQFYSNKAYNGTIALNKITLGGTTAAYHVFNFDTLTPAQQRDKPFGYGPYWDADSGWNAGAWDSSDITAVSGTLAITTNFQTDPISPTKDIPERKGFIGLNAKPTLDLRNKTNRVIRAEARFDPPLQPGQMIVSIYVGAPCQGSTCQYFRRQFSVSGSMVNELTFDLDNPTEFVDPAECPDCLPPSAVTLTNTADIRLVGFEFYANQPYTGVITLDNITLGGTELDNFDNLNQDFVTRSGSAFVLDNNPNRPYRFTGTNSYYIVFKSHFMIDDLLDMLERNNLHVLRMWGFMDGKAPYVDDNDNGLPNGNEGNALQPEKGLYYEPTFRQLDYVIKAAGERGIRLILPLVNHWSDKDKRQEGERANAFGGMAQYLEWCDVPLTYTGEEIDNKHLFYTNTCAKDAYETYVSYVLNRKNSLTGVAYKDDPTILAWELANEPRCHHPSLRMDQYKTYLPIVLNTKLGVVSDCQGTQTFLSWASEMSAYIKSIDKKHMVAVGDEGGLNEPGYTDPFYTGADGIDWRAVVRLSTIDFGTVHVYPDWWGKDLQWASQWITDHINIAQQINKAVVFEEFGICQDDKPNPYLTIPCHDGPDFARDATYITWTKQFERGADGDLVWLIAGRVNGIQDPHVPIDGQYYYPDYDGFTFWEPITSTMTIIRNHANVMNSTPDLSGDRSDTRSSKSGAARPEPVEQATPAWLGRLGGAIPSKPPLARSALLRATRAAPAGRARSRTPSARSRPAAARRGS